MNYLIRLCFASVMAAVVVEAYIYIVPQLPKLPQLPQLQTISHSLIGPIREQYYTQNHHGQYAYGYSEPLSSKQEVRTADGVTRGSYSYVDAAGQVQTVSYIADAGGFRVAATNLPVPPTSAAVKPVKDTPEVAAAKQEHLAAHQQALLRSTVATNALQIDDQLVGPASSLPQPVTDTPEVSAAKAEFFARYEEEKLRHKSLSTKESANYTAIKSQHIIATWPLLSYKFSTPNRKPNYLPVL